MPSKNCRDCRFILTQDYGYSNYTVEGVTAYCLLEASPEMPTDNWYGEAVEFGYAEQCRWFIAGSLPELSLDVDGDQAKVLARGDVLPPDLQMLYEKWLTEDGL